MGQSLPDDDVIEIVGHPLSEQAFVELLLRRAEFLSVSAPWGVDADGLLLRRAAEVIVEQGEWITYLESESKNEDYI